MFLRHTALNMSCRCILKPSLTRSMLPFGFRRGRFISGMGHDPEGVIPTLSKLQNILGNKINFPRIVVVGNQSAGKSSVLEAIVGQDFLPKGNNMVTTRPIEITLVREQSGTWASFPNGQKITIMKELKEKILEENKEAEFSTIPLKLEFHSPDVHNVTLVDLPGYILATKRGQERELPKRIKELCTNYIQNSDNIIVCVISAAEDVAMSVGIKESQRYDKEGDRSMGILTKIDTKPSAEIVNTLQNNEYYLPLGYIGVRCRTVEELAEGIDFNTLIEREEDLIKKRKIRQEGVKVGIPTLREELSKELLFKISGVFPKILQQLDEIIAKTKKDAEFLTTLSKEPDLSKIAKELEKLVTFFHPSAPTRLEFEKSCRKNITEITHQYWESAIKQVWDKLNPENNSPADNNKIDVTFHKRIRSLMYDMKVNSNNSLDMEPFSNFFIFGEGSPDKLDDNTLNKLDQNLLISGLNAPFYKLSLSEDYQRIRIDWQGKLSQTVDLITSHDPWEGKNSLGEATRKAAIQSLIEFVDAFAKSHNRSEVVLANFFFKFLLEQVSQRTDKEGLFLTIDKMLAREKRAQAGYLEFFHSLREQLKLPVEESDSMFSFTNNKFPVTIEAYKDAWTAAYFAVVKKRTSDDIFRLLAVDVINPLIFETIHYSLNLFKSGRIFREANRQSKKIEELEQYRKIIARASETYTEKAIKRNIELKSKKSHMTNVNIKI